MQTEPNSSAPKVFFPNLDGFRFLAFFIVYLQHGFYTFYSYFEPKSGIAHWLGAFVFANGFMGVSAFFVLSGFLITYLILSEIKARSRLDILAFYARRALRIFPLYYVVIGFALFLYPALKAFLGMTGHDPARPLFYISFLSNFDVIRTTLVAPGESAMSAGLTWSISVEEQFYLLWPLLLGFTPARLRFAIFFILIGISTWFRAMHSQDSVTLSFHSLSVISDLALGGLSAFYAIESKAFIAFFQSLRPKQICLAYALGTTMLIYVYSLEASLVSAIFRRLLMASFFAFLILEQNFGSWQRLRFSNNRFFTFWGKYTYGLYLLHAIALTILISVMKALHTNANSVTRQFIFGLAGLLLSFLLSFVSYHFLENPFLELKKRFAYIKKS